MTDAMNRQARQRWAPERISKLKHLWETGVPTASIGIELGCAPGAVIAKAQRQRFLRPPRKWPASLEDKLKEMWLAGVSTAEIGIAFDLNKGAVCGKVRRMGLPMRKSMNAPGPTNPNWRGGLAARRARRNSIRRKPKVHYPSERAPRKPSKYKPGRLCFRLGLYDRFYD